MNEIKETDENGNEVIKKVNSDGNIVSIKVCHDDGSYTLTNYNKDNTISSIKEYKDESNYVETEYKNGNINLKKETVDGAITISSYNNGKIELKEERKEYGIRTRYYYDENENEVLIQDIQGGKVINEKQIQYSDNERKEKTYINDKLTSIKTFLNNEDNPNYSVEYEYDGENIQRKTINTKLNNNQEEISVVNNHIYSYDENNKITCKNEFIINGEKLISFNNEDVNIEYKDDKYIFTDTNAGTKCEIDSFGNREYTIDNNQLIFNNDGTFYLSSKNIEGHYQINENGELICKDKEGNNYLFNSTGQLMKEETSNGTITYDYDNLSKNKIINGENNYSLINSIEYDEEAYQELMKGLIRINTSYTEKMDTDCEKIKKIVNDFYDEYNSSNINNVKKEINKELQSILDLKEKTNYSLLAYQTADEQMKEKINHYIIDNLFDDNEKTIEKTFKESINSNIEDRNNDGILEYKKNTNFKRLYENVIPAHQYIDENGNIWYFNKNKNLISADGNNLKITYGDEEFSVSFTDNGLIKLVDSEGKPLNIFADYNISSSQYGGNQGDILNVDLLKDDNVKMILNKYFSSSNPEEISQYLNTIAHKGCGYTAITNYIFKELEGKEEEFYNIFDIPMYNVKMNDDGSIGSVDYNYEPIIIDLFSASNNVNGVYEKGIDKGGGMSKYQSNKITNYLNEKYGIMLGDDSFDPLYSKYGMFGDSYYKLYTMDGELYFDASTYENGASHAMTKIGETSDGKWIVSTWGEKLLCEVNNPQKY